MLKISGMQQWLGGHLHNLSGWKTKRKIVVFESDDWGSIRMPSREVYDIFNKKGYPVNLRPFEQYDSLESIQDVEALFNVLAGVRDHTGNPCLFTGNTIMTNPDFRKIRESGFENYHAEIFTDSYKKYKGSETVFSAFMQGYNERLFKPQYHGFSHFNYQQWLTNLCNKWEDDLLSFEYGMVGITSRSDLERGNQLLVALQFRNKDEFQRQLNDTEKGAELFKNVFGYSSESFIAPVYTWNSQIEKTLSTCGVKYIQGGRYQKEPLLPNGELISKKHITGDQNIFDQYYLVRNVFFEPATNPDRDWVDESLSRIQKAFFWGKPAIISTHRLNYIGRIFPENSNKNLKLLERLLKRIISIWPDAEFMSSDELGNLISMSKK